MQAQAGNENAGDNYEGYANITKVLIVNVNGSKWSVIDISGLKVWF